MDNKTKVKVAVVIGIVILAIIFLVMVVFVKGNKTPVNKNIPTKGQEGYVDPTQNTTDGTSKENTIDKPSSPVDLQNVVSLGIKSGDLVKINSDLSSTVVKKIENGFKEYCYGDENVYILTGNEDGSYSIIEVDLSKSNYPEKILLTTADYGFITNIEYYAGKLYFISQIGQLIEFSISENYFKALTNANEVSSFTINKDKNNMYISYKPNGENAGIYILDFTTNSFTQIISLNDLAGKLILSDNSLVIDVKEFSSLYVYNIEHNSVVAIGTDNYLSSADKQVAFYDNVLLYTNGTTVDIKNSSGESFQDGWYTLNDSSIAGISMISSSKLQIERYDIKGQASGVTRSIIIDLSSGETTEMSDSVYNEVIRIK